MPVTTLTRYLVRALAGPFAFAFFAVTGLLFLTAVAQRFQELAGKGVGPGVILELMLLSLPHVVTLSVPMALFAATLYVFADLSHSRALVALAAGGVHPGRLMAPVVLLGLAVSLVMVPFNGRVLPGANARFQDRLEDVGRKSPTLRLREGVMNALHTADGSLRYLWVRSIEPGTGALGGVAIVDLSRADRPRYVTAEHAYLALLPNGRDLVLRLTDGHISSLFLDRPETFQTSRFEAHLVALRDVAAEVERGERLGERAERELSIAALRARIREAQPSTHAVVVRSLGEVHRRYATAFACLVFVLLAPPLGLRFAHGGLGSVILLSVAVLFFFRVGIIWGDRLADAGRIPPILGGWGAVGVLLLVALPLLPGLADAPPDPRTPPGTVGGRRPRPELP